MRRSVIPAVVVFALCIAGCEFHRGEHLNTQRVVNANTNDRAEELSDQIKAAAPDDRQAALDKLRKDMERQIVDSEKRAQEELEASRAKFERNLGAITGLAQSFGVPAAFMDIATGSALGQAITSSVSRVSADTRMRDEAIEAALRTTNTEVGEVKKTSAKNATDLATLLAADAELKKLYDSLSTQVQKKLSDVSGTVHTEVAEILRTGKTDTEIWGRLEVLLKQKGFSDEDIREMKDKGLAWQDVVAILVGGGVIAGGGGAVAGRVINRPQENQMRERLSTVETSIGVDGKHAKPYIDELYEQIEALRASIAAAGVQVAAAGAATSGQPIAAPAGTTINITASGEPPVCKFVPSPKT